MQKMDSYRLHYQLIKTSNPLLGFTLENISKLHKKLRFDKKV